MDNQPTPQEIERALDEAYCSIGRSDVHCDADIENIQRVLEWLKETAAQGV